MESIYKAKLRLIEFFEKIRFTNLDEKIFEEDTSKQKRYKKQDHYRAN
ncbi:MAG: hypothetical protein NTW30_01155 [Candidatus Aenigmarchaeota archaeon]|nr:hypothetical protein [Candidatus Aenigmarchaeota archaeon]